MTRGGVTQTDLIGKEAIDKALDAIVEIATALAALRVRVNQREAEVGFHAAECALLDAAALVRAACVALDDEPVRRLA